MTTTAIYDIESNGLLTEKRERDGSVCPPMDRVHTVTIILQRPGEDERRISACNQPGYERFTSGRGWERMPIVDALQILELADVRVAHNGQDFDERAIPLIYPWFKPKPGSMLFDTLLLSRVLYPDIHRTGPNPHKLMGFEKRQHSLSAWGKRLGEHKGEYKGGWAAWSEEMQSYGEQDTVVLAKLFKWLMAQKPDPRSVAVEHDFAAVIRRQETRGFAFNHTKALNLLAALQTRETYLEAQLIEAFGEWWAYGKAANSGAGKPEKDNDDDDLADDPEEQEKRRLAWLARKDWGDVIIPTKTRRVKLPEFPNVTLPRFSATTGKPLKDYVGPPLREITAGSAYTPVKRIQFNPGSRAHVRQRLIVKYGWEPSKFTKGGKDTPPQPVVDDDVLSALPYPEAKLLAEYYLVLKRIGMLSAGKKAWLKVCRETEQPNGQKTYRIHGRVNTCGAGTGRCTHSDPNLAQVPKNTAGTKQYPDAPMLHGSACRDLFEAAAPYELVGFDGSSLELCMLAHYTSAWDKGEYATVVSEGDKSKGTDPHSWLRDLVGTNLLGAGDLGRDNAKTTMYAFVYGAGNEKLGSIVLPHGTLSEKREVGAEVKAKVMGAFTAMGKLQQAIEQAVEATGRLTGLDGRILRVRKPHAALNTLLQSAGAVVMKKSLILLDASVQAHGLRCGTDYEFVVNVHDEAQAEVLPEHVPLYSRLALACVPNAGTALRVKCPLKAEVAPSPDHRPARSWMQTH
ncbi:DNA polymerase [Novosphingobium sp.]|uniref:DNA polymerase n=1 Tax=Novosphingobium sp. TaxID=1874826 RepID=UPI003B51CD94